MDERQLLKKVMESPETIGEREQSRRLNRFSKNPDEIIKIRRKLKELKDELETSEESLSFQKELYSKKNEIPRFRNRYYDKSVIKTSPGGIMRLFGRYFTLKRDFNRKYRLDSPITSSVLNFLSHGAPFCPSERVCSYVQEILIMQEELREPFSRMYSSGWLDRLGADVLTPLEFNLISEMERLVNDPSIFNFLICYRKPRTALTRINPFLGYYLSVTRNNRFRMKLHDAVRKSLRKILYTDPRESGRVDRIMGTLEKFLSDTTEQRFIIPLFECAYLRPLSGEDLRDLLFLDDLDETAYRADSRLVEIMDERKKHFNELLKKNIFSLEDELNFVLELKDIVETPQTLPDESAGDFLDHLLHYYYSRAGKAAARANSVPVTAGDLCDIFTLTYQTALCDGVTLKARGDMKSIPLFEKSLFEKETETIRNERRVFSNYDRKDYTPHLLYKESPDGEELFFINSLTRVVDAFYSIGLKLYSIIRGHEDSNLKDEKTVESRISEKTMGKTRVPYSNHIIAGNQTSGAFLFTMANRRVMETLEDAKKFCFSFAHRFEYRRRDFPAGARTESIAEKIRKLDEIIEKIKRLESGQAPGAQGPGPLPPVTSR